MPVMRVLFSDRGYFTTASNKQLHSNDICRHAVILFAIDDIDQQRMFPRRESVQVKGNVRSGEREVASAIKEPGDTHVAIVRLYSGMKAYERGTFSPALCVCPLKCAGVASALLRCGRAGSRRDQARPYRYGDMEGWCGRRYAVIWIPRGRGNKFLSRDAAINAAGNFSDADQR